MLMKYVAQRQISNGSYPSAAFVLSGALAHVPVAVIESFVFCAIL